MYSLSSFCLLYFIFATNSSMSQKAERPKLNLNNKQMQTNTKSRYKHT